MINLNCSWNDTGGWAAGMREDRFITGNKQEGIQWGTASYPNSIVKELSQSVPSSFRFSSGHMEELALLWTKVYHFISRSHSLLPPEGSQVIDYLLTLEFLTD